MDYLDTLPKRIVTVYIPLVLIMVVLLFPFYWMVLTAIKPDEQLLDLERFNPYFVTAPTFKHIYKLLFETAYPRWLWNTMFISVAATAAVAVCERARRLCHHPHPLSRRKVCRRARSSSPISFRPRSCSSRSRR